MPADVGWSVVGERNRRGQPVVTLYSKSNALTKPVKDWFLAEGVELRIIDTVPPKGVQAQFLLHGCSLSATVEKAAARVGGVPAVVPEALDYVLGKCQEGKVDTMVGFEWAKDKRI